MAGVITALVEIGAPDLTGYRKHQPVSLNKYLERDEKTYEDNFDKVIGLKRLKALHLNDSIAEFLSKRDRHQHIGKGEIGLDGFAALLNALKNILHV